MARIRSIKPEFWDDRKLARSTSRDARLLYIGLWNQADEHGRCNGDLAWIKGRVFPYESDLGADECARLLDELARGAWVQKYTVNGDPFLFLPRLAKHQRLESEKVPSRLPGPDEADPEASPDQQQRGGANESARDSDESAPGEDESSLLYVAGGREHVSPPASRAGAPAPKPGSDDDPHWLKFWEAYPRRVGKEDARKAWAAAIKARCDPEEIVAGAVRYAAEMKRLGSPKDKIKYPQGWLTGKRWNDDLTAATSKSGSVGGWMDN
ncbi:hypothetical protein [Actinomadura sp. 9N215]|uniref:hypothetical protein n=1 Tax=Actinomadura sp. 9N215 TaxID=3375150 RepID=UPI00378DD954